MSAIERHQVNRIVNLMLFLDSDSLDRIIAAAEYQLRERQLEEQAKQDYDDPLARQYEADQVDDFLRHALTELDNFLEPR